MLFSTYDSMWKINEQLSLCKNRWKVFTVWHHSWGLAVRDYGVFPEGPRRWQNCKDVWRPQIRRERGQQQQNHSSAPSRRNKEISIVETFPLPQCWGSRSGWIRNLLPAPDQQLSILFISPLKLNSCKKPNNCFWPVLWFRQGSIYWFKTIFIPPPPWKMIFFPQKLDDFHGPIPTTKQR